MLGDSCCLGLGEACHVRQLVPAAGGKVGDLVGEGHKFGVVGHLAVCIISDVVERGNVAVAGQDVGQLGQVLGCHLGCSLGEVFAWAGPGHGGGHGVEVCLVASSEYRILQGFGQPL